MNKKGWYIGIMVLSSGWLFAQGEMDAYRFSQTELNGTARSMSMGGAFGALGGDMSVMSHNPAGLGVYRSSVENRSEKYRTVQHGKSGRKARLSLEKRQRV